MIVKPFNILIKVSESERDKLYNKRLKTADGRILSILQDVEHAADTDEFFSQDVNAAEVIAVGEGVDFIKVGDTVIIDYLVDTTPDFTAWEEWTGKFCVLDTRTIYYDHDKMVPASRHTKVDAFVYRKGEMDSYSFVIAVIRGNTVIPNAGYIFTEHKDSSKDAFSNGIEYAEHEKHIIKRKLLFGHPDCKLPIGKEVILESDFIFFRKIGETVFDICFESDVVGYVN